RRLEAAAGQEVTGPPCYIARRPADTGSAARSNRGPDRRPEEDAGAALPDDARPHAEGQLPVGPDRVPARRAGRVPHPADAAPSRPQGGRLAAAAGAGPAEAG